MIRGAQKLQYVIIVKFIVQTEKMPQLLKLYDIPNGESCKENP